ncbi:hypothetical protein [Oceanobacter mangrovi]|uniref:hypothetical protein n=1 Tax=Oceanobacter mangrovi TaxID=2862510 RepID=UPI001C8E638A|nr:hypothetical protein [Oceanobacter mangrovi]
MSAFTQPPKHHLAADTELLKSIEYMYTRKNRVGYSYLCIRWNKTPAEVEKIVRSRKFPRRITGLQAIEKNAGYWTPADVHAYEKSTGMEVVNP